MSQKLAPISRVALFVDGQNLFFAIKKHGLPLPLDYEQLAQALALDHGLLVKKFYVTGVWISPEERIAQRPFLDALRYRGWKVAETRVEEKPRGKVEKESDVALAWEMAADALADCWDTLVLLSGDGDLAYAVRQVGQRGKRVVVAQFQDFISLHLAKAAHEVKLLSEADLQRFSYRKSA
ncbi:MULTISPECIES: NYN domain-containing protein [unclassified Meiothermus]|uniref:LabA-like NYN domain-containing protein n=1 Tax=unclassified Meiothermus TaxID=370471 RepID=UPI000D7C236D|nr:MULTISPECIES: NYN domain-containing protein [unclassified Meiothermus]PZA06063.1 NYN domain-containing protein [Meiothermus sp. Pnk-1]RYM31411.1 NYN domain-containing protein [Meiothermus sp. PNK-Is4]